MRRDIKAIVNPVLLQIRDFYFWAMGQRKHPRALIAMNDGLEVVHMVNELAGLPEFVAEARVPLSRRVTSVFIHSHWLRTYGIASPLPSLAHALRRTRTGR
jgi:hypothetical protein